MDPEAPNDLFKDFPKYRKHNHLAYFSSANVSSLQKRLKGTSRVEQRDFNIKRFEDENPFYISTKGPLSKDDDETQRPEHFELNREKILFVRNVMLTFSIDRAEALLAP